MFCKTFSEIFSHLMIHSCSFTECEALAIFCNKSYLYSNSRTSCISNSSFFMFCLAKSDFLCQKVQSQFVLLKAEILKVRKKSRYLEKAAWRCQLNLLPLTDA